MIVSIHENQKTCDVSATVVEFDIKKLMSEAADNWSNWRRDKNGDLVIVAGFKTLIVNKIYVRNNQILYERNKG